MQRRFFYFFNYFSLEQTRWLRTRDGAKPPLGAATVGDKPCHPPAHACDLVWNG